jgi:hypothetical protein
MGSTDRGRRIARRRRCPVVERLETLDLMSVVPIYMAHQMGHSRTVPTLAPAAITSSETGQPTPHELARQRFVAHANGPFVTGPGRFTDQLLQGSIEASGGSNQSLNLVLRMAFFVPTDPTQPVTGVATLIPRNVSTTGSTLILDLTAAPGSGTNALPTHFTWTVDPSSGGLYSNAAGFGMGQGTLDVHYRRGGKAARRNFPAGHASVAVKGLINTGSVFSDVGGPGNM